MPDYPSPTGAQGLAPLCQGYDARTSGITGFLIDLDGTTYEPGGLIPGARRFYKWLRANNIPFVFLSNTGAKSSADVQAKLRTPPYQLDEAPIGLEHIHTAA
eukprot:1531161-Prymnesium_polylepis.1